MIGRIVGNYRIAEKIGEGGMGTVYRAVDLMLEREVALKAIRQELSREPQIVERFRSEARILARVSHPGIANVYTFFYEEDELFLAMEFVRGKSLSKVLADGGAITWQRAVPLLASALEGIEQAHRAGIVHRDLKPDNLIMTESGTLKVMDFGIARVMGSGHLTRTGLLVGTLRYMAPEQVRGEEVDARTDVYALGAVLYEMLTGRTPFEGSSDWAILRAQIEDPPRPPGEQVPDIPWWLDRAVLRALAKQPAERFQSVEEMRLCLLRQGQTAPSARPSPAVLEEMPTVVTPPGARPTPAFTPPPTLPSMASPPLAASGHTTSAGPPPLTPPPVTPPTPPPVAAIARPATMPPPPPATSYRPVGMPARSGTGRKIAVIVAAVLAFIGAAFIGLLLLNSLTGDTKPADGTAATTAPEATPAASTAPASLPETQQPEPAASPFPRPRKPEPAAEPETSETEATSEEPATTEEEPAAPATGTYNAPEEPPPSSPPGPARFQELHTIAAELDLKSAELVDSYKEFLDKKEDGGAELTPQDEKLRDDLDAFQDAAENFDKQFQVGRFARIWGRRADDRARIGQRYRELTQLGQEVDQLMSQVRPSSDVRQSWGEVRSRWKRVGEIVSGL